MAVFVVYIQDEERQQIQTRLQERYPEPQHFGLEDNLYLVRSDSIAQSIAEALGIKGEGRDSTGVVFKLNASYAGFADRSIWEWLALEERTQ